MTCRSCGAVIAEKAIVCYRCGTPTASPATPSRAPAPSAGRRRLVPFIALVEIIAAIVVVFMLGYQDSPVAWAIATGVALSSILLVGRVLK